MLNARRLGGNPNPQISAAYQGLTTVHANGSLDWSGDVRFMEDRLTQPLRWKKPRRIFVNSMSDLFHESVPDAWIAAIFGIMAATPRHTYQVLTKRPSRMSDWFQWIDGYGSSRWCVDAAEHIRPDLRPLLPGNSPSWPLCNVMLGVSVEDQAAANDRIPWLLQTPAPVRFLSVEPLLGPINLAQACPCLYYCDESIGHVSHPFLPDQNGTKNGGIAWVIAGGESGPGYRPMDLAWLASVVAQCQAAGVKVFVKQDAGLRPGRQGRIPDELWKLKEFPHAH